MTSALSRQRSSPACRPVGSQHKGGRTTFRPCALYGTILDSAGQAGEPGASLALYSVSVPLPQASQLCRALSACLRAGPHLFHHDHGHHARVAARPAGGDRRPDGRGDTIEAAALCRRVTGHRAGRRRLPLLDAAHPHRRVTRHRVRHAQRVLRAFADAATVVLPGEPHRRPDVARHQRPQRRADDGRAIGHVLRQYAADLRRGAGDDALHRRAADAAVADPAAVCLDLGELLRRRHPQGVRAHPGAALRGERRCSGGAVGRARGACLPPGGLGTRTLPAGQPRVRAPQPEAHRAAGGLLPDHVVLPRAEFDAGAVARQPCRHRAAHHAGRVRRLLRLSHHALVADDCVWLGDEHAAARHGELEADARHSRYAARHPRRR